MRLDFITFDWIYRVLWAAFGLLAAPACSFAVGLAPLDWPLFHVVEFNGRSLEAPIYVRHEEIKLFHPSPEEIAIFYNDASDPLSTALDAAERDRQNSPIENEILARQALLKVIEVVRTMIIENEEHLDERDFQFFVSRKRYAHIKMSPNTFERIRKRLSQARVRLSPESSVYGIDWEQPSSLAKSQNGLFWWYPRWENQVDARVNSVLKAASKIHLSAPGSNLHPARQMEVLTPTLIATTEKLLALKSLSAPRPINRLQGIELNAKDWVEIKMKAYANEILRLNSSRYGARLFLVDRGFWPVVIGNFLYEAAPRSLSDLVFLRYARPKLMALSSVGILSVFSLTRSVGVDPFENWEESDDAFFLEHLEALAEDLFRSGPQAKLDGFSQTVLLEIASSSKIFPFLRQSAIRLLARFGDITALKIADEKQKILKTENSIGLDLNYEDSPLIPVSRFFISNRWVSTRYLVRLAPGLHRAVMGTRPNLNALNIEIPKAMHTPVTSSNFLAIGAPAANDCDYILKE